MGRLKKTLALLICLVVALALVAGPAFAKGVSSGGRSSFSSGSKGVSSSKSYSSGSSGYSSKSSSGGGAASTAPSTSSSSSKTSGTAGDSASSSSSSYGKGYSTDTQDFSTPRQGTPPATTKDYSTGKSGYSTGTGSYTTDRQSYKGTWDRSVSPESDIFPQKQPVGVFGSPPYDPYYYHNSYWGAPLWTRMLFQPNYYYTPWGYHYYAPRLLTWIVALGLLGGGGFLIYRFMRRKI